MNKISSVLLSSLILAACTSNEPPITRHETNVQISNYLDLTKKNGVTLPLEKQRTLFQKYWNFDQVESHVVRINPKKKRKSGCVEALLAISKEGKVTAYTITKSYPKGFFDERAISHWKAIRWKPAENNIDKTPVLTTKSFMYKTLSSNRAEASKECNWGR